MNYIIFFLKTTFYIGQSVKQNYLEKLIIVEMHWGANSILG